MAESTVTTVVAARVPNEHAEQLRHQAMREGMTLSKVASIVIARGLVGDDQDVERGELNDQAQLNGRRQ